ncbi:deoxyribodipyrimidine photo-lyase [bacterium]|nr:deoxyribodipyrimidine photo-lyase [bacterium]
MVSVDLNKAVVWVHGDVLSPYGPALSAEPDAPAVFVWDDALLTEWRISLKRIAFIYECLLELPVTIRRGDVAAEVAAFAQSHGAGRIVTAESPSPRFRDLCRAISHAMPSGSRLEVLRVEPFVAHDGPLDLKRFSRYWQAVKDDAMR